ncbi:hypothetical protein V8C40DRAFT_257815 [Trichoderma camerunense]
MTAQAFDVASPKELHKAENNPRLRPSTTLNTPTRPSDLRTLSRISPHLLSTFFAFYSTLSFRTTLGFLPGALLLARSCYLYLDHIEVATELMIFGMRSYVQLNERESKGSLEGGGVANHRQQMAPNSSEPKNSAKKLSCMLGNLASSYGQDVTFAMTLLKLSNMKARLPDPDNVIKRCPIIVL